MMGVANGFAAVVIESDGVPKAPEEAAIVSHGAAT